MEFLNYHHLRYFWVVAQEGGLRKASEKLHVSQPTISAQIAALEGAFGEKLFRRGPRGLTLTETGHQTFSYAEEIFALGQDLLDTVKQRPTARPLRVNIGIADSLPKLVSHEIIKPIFSLSQPIQAVCQENKTSDLLAQLAVYRLDIVLADEPAPSGLPMKTFNHLLGESGVTFCAARELAVRLRRRFPSSLHNEPMLLPTAGSAIRRTLEKWFQQQSIPPRVVAEYDDAALMTVAAAEGLGCLPLPTVAVAETAARYGFQIVGQAKGCTVQFYAISAERKLTHPAVVAITSKARADFLGRLHLARNRDRAFRRYSTSSPACKRSRGILQKRVPDTPDAMVQEAPAPGRRSLARFAWLSIGAALLTMGLKTVAYLLTGSVGLLSDAIESVVNLVGGMMALAMLTVAARPADEDHAFGHGKAEYFSSGVEGTLILLAAVSIGIASVERLITPKALEQVSWGLAVSVVASLVNLVVALLLLRVGRKQSSITLEANAHHLMTDVWTSVGVVVGVGVVALTSWQRLDPIVALVVAANIVWTGISIVRRSIAGLMDIALSGEELGLIHKALETYRRDGLEFHALRTRRAGASRFVTLHVLVPGDWTVQRGHEVLERLEGDVRLVLPNAILFTHLEPLGDPASWGDAALERKEAAPGTPALDQRQQKPFAKTDSSSN